MDTKITKTKRDANKMDDSEQLNTEKHGEHCNTVDESAGDVGPQAHDNKAFEDCDQEGTKHSQENPREQDHEEQRRPNGVYGTFGMAVETPEVEKSRWRSIRIMYYTMLVANVSLTIIMSSAYPYLKILDELATTEFLGWVVAAYSLGQLVAAPALGAWSNWRGSAREPLVVSMMLKIPANLLYMYLQSVPAGAKYLMIAARALVGFGSGNIAVVRSYVSAATTLKERTPVMANMAAIQTIGFILGPLIQAAFVPVDYPGFVHTTALYLNMYTFPALLCAVLDAINLALLIVVFKEHRIRDAPDVQDEEGAKIPDETDSDKPLDYVAVISTIALFFSVMFTFIVLETIVTPLCMHMFAWTKSEATLYVGILLGSTAIVSVAVFIAIKVLSKRFNERYLLLWGFVFFLVGFFMYLPWGRHYPKIQRSKTVDEPEYVLANSTLLTAENKTADGETGEESAGCPDIYRWCFDTPAILLWQLLLASAVIAVAYPTCYVLCFTIYSKILGPKPQGVWMGWITAAGSLARTIGPVFVSALYDATGPRVTFSAMLGWIALTIVGFLIVFRRLLPFKNI